MLGLPGTALPHGRELVETGDARLASSSSSFLMEGSWSRQGMLGLPGTALPHGRELVETGDARLASSSSSSWKGAGRDRGC